MTIYVDDFDVSIVVLSKTASSKEVHEHVDYDDGERSPRGDLQMFFKRSLHEAIFKCSSRILIAVCGVPLINDFFDPALTVEERR